MKELRIDYPFLLGFDLSNANSFNEYQVFMAGCLFTGKDDLDGSDKRIL